MPDFSNSRLLAMITPSTDWASTLDFATYERAEGLPPGLLTAVMRAESAGDPAATSRAGAGGLFQLMPKTAAYYDVDPYDPQQAVEGATAELGALYRKYNKDLPMTLAAWNWGQGNLDKQGLAKAPAETQGFVQRVTGFLGPRSAEAASPPAPRTYSNDELLRMITPAAPAQPQPAMPPQAASQPPPAPSPPLADTLPSYPPASSLGEVAWSGPGQRVNTGQQAQPVDLVVNIEKPSTPQPRLPGMPAPSEFALSGDILSDTSSITPSTGMTPEERAQAQHDVAMHWLSLPAAGLSAGITGAATVGAARVLPATAQKLLPVIGSVASYLARKLNVELGLEEPGTTGDVVSVAMPLLPYAERLGKAGARKIASWTRAGRALTTAEQETADQTANAAAQHAARQQAGVEAAQKRQTSYDLNQRRVEAVEARQQATRAQQVLDAQEEARLRTLAQQEGYALRQQEAYDEAAILAKQRQAEYARLVTERQQAADEATRLLQEAHATRQQDLIDAATETAQQRIADYKQALTDYRSATQAHGAAVERLQGLPQRYLPQMPARNMTDVQRDLALLEQPTARQQVIERLGATDLNDAVRLLSDEGETLMQAGQRLTRPGEPIAPSYRQPTPKLPGMEVEDTPSILRFIANNGRVRLQGDEIGSDFGTMLKGYVNNKSGKTLDEMAQAAYEAHPELVAGPDKRDLLDAVREATRPRQARSAYEAPPLPGTAPAAVSMPPSAKAPQSASRMLYQRLEEVAGSSPVDLTPTVEVALGLQGQMGQGIPAMQPTRLSRILTDLTEMGDRGSVAQVHSMLKELGPLTRENDGRIRGAAKQLVGSLQQSLTQSAMEWPETAGARQLLAQANAAYRQEQAVGDLRRILTPGGQVLKYDAQGRLTMNPAALLNQIERHAARDPFFKGSFSPEDYAALQDDLRSFVGTPPMPKQPPPLPGAVPVRDLGPAPAPVQPKPVPLPGPVRVRSIGPEPVPVEPREIPPLAPRIPTVREMRGRPGDYVSEPFTPPAPVEPSMEGMGPHWQRLFGLGGSGVIESAATGHFPYLSAGLLTADMAEYALSRILLTPTFRPLLRQVIHPQTGQIDPYKLAALAAMVPGLTDELTPAEGGR